MGTITEKHEGATTAKLRGNGSAASRRCANALVAMRIALCALALIAVAAICSMASFSSDTAYAVDAGGDGYVQEFMDKETNGLDWREEIVTNVEGYQDPGGGTSNAQGVISFVSDLLNYVSVFFLGIAIVVLVARLVGRALLEMMNWEHSKIPKFFKTNRSDEERGSTWLVPMLKQSGLYFAIAIGVFVIFQIIAQVIAMLWSAAV